MTTEVHDMKQILDRLRNWRYMKQFVLLSKEEAAEIADLLEGKIDKEEMMSDKFDTKVQAAIERFKAWAHYKHNEAKTPPLDEDAEAMAQDIDAMLAHIESLEKRNRDLSRYWLKKYKDHEEAANNKAADLQRENDALREQDELHWKTRKTLVAANAALKEELERCLRCRSRSAVLL